MDTVDVVPLSTVVRGQTTAHRTCVFRPRTLGPDINIGGELRIVREVHKGISRVVTFEERYTVDADGYWLAEEEIGAGWYGLRYAMVSRPGTPTTPQ